MALFSVTLSDP